MSFLQIFVFTLKLKTWTGVSFEAFPLKPISCGIGLDMKKSPCPDLWSPDCNKRYINFKFMRSTWKGKVRMPFIEKLMSIQTTEIYFT